MQQPGFPKSEYWPYGDARVIHSRIDEKSEHVATVKQYSVANTETFAEAGQLFPFSIRERSSTLETSIY